MAERRNRPPVADRARRRAIRAYAARLGVPYSVAARLMASPANEVLDEHRAWLFATREQRAFAQRVADTRLAVDLPMGRAEHLARRFPVLRRSAAGPMYDGDARTAVLAMLYAAAVHESPRLRPAVGELDWVAGLGEETAVDVVYAGLDAAARRLLDDERWRLCARIDAALDAAAAAPDRTARDIAGALVRQLRTTIMHRSWEGARHTLDALLVAVHDGYAPGDRIHAVAGRYAGRAVTVLSLDWRPTGEPDCYRIRVDNGPEQTAVPVGDLGHRDSPMRPEPVRQ